MGVKKKHIFIALFCFYMAAVLFLCLVKPDELPQTELYFFGLPLDKVAHLVMFMPFPFLSQLMFMEKSRRIYADIIILICLTAMGVGLAFGTEQLQALTQYRTSDINDVYADITGLGVGCVLTLILIINRHSR